jgi:DNA-binding PadR family transcriptional regulator
MNEKQIAVLKLLMQEGGNVSSYMVVQLCDLYRDTSLTLAVLTQERYIKSTTTRYGVSYRITEKGRSELALSQRAEMVSECEPTTRPLSLWDVLPRNYKPRTPAFEGGAVAWWNSRDPWATGKEAYRRKDEQRRIMRGEFVPPWFNKGVSK